MNEILNNWFSKFFLFCMILGILFSCEDRGIVDTNYPEQGVFMPMSRLGIYEVNDTTGSVNPFARYVIDSVNHKLLIPIGVYRSGVDCNGKVTVDLGVYNDTIQNLIDNKVFRMKTGDQTPAILPVGSYSLPSQVDVKDGADYALFNLEIDLPFIQANLGKRYALAIKITGSSKVISKTYNTAIIDFDSRFTGAMTKFSFKANKSDSKLIEFTNLTTYGLSYKWDFGNGNKSTEKNPPPQAYSDYGTYKVSLTSTGIDGKQNTYTQNVVIWNVITSSYIMNAGDPFKRAGVVTSGRTDVIANWSYTPNILSTVSGGKNIGGWQGDNGGVMDFFANSSTTPNGLVNAKIYQTFELEAGYYQFGFIQYSLTGVNNCFAVVSLGTGLPDIVNINSDTNVLGKFNWNEASNLGDQKQGVEFRLDSKQTITVGFVVSNTVNGRVKIKGVSLAK